MIIQQKVRFHGNIQGIGFRYRVKQRAQALGIVGWIKNDPNQTVRAVFCGEHDRVQKILEEIPLMSGIVIEKTDIKNEPVQSWNEFKIEYDRA